MVFEDDCRFTVGLAGGATGVGGGGGGAWGAGFLHAALKARIASKVPNRILACVRVRIFLILPPLTIYVSFGSECKYDLKPSDLLWSKCAVIARERLIWATSWGIHSGPVLKAGGLAFRQQAWTKFVAFLFGWIRIRDDAHREPSLAARCGRHRASVRRAGA